MSALYGRARTIADLDGAGSLGPKRVSEAVQYRSLDRRQVACGQRTTLARVSTAAVAGVLSTALTFDTLNVHKLETAQLP